MASYTFLHASSPYATTSTATSTPSKQRASSPLSRPASRRTHTALRDHHALRLPPEHPNRGPRRSPGTAAWAVGVSLALAASDPATEAIATHATDSNRESRPDDSPRFSRLLSSVLGSPFLTTTDLPFQPDLMDLETQSPDERPTSPVPSVDFSIIDVDLDDPELHFSSNTPIPGAYPLLGEGCQASGTRGLRTTPNPLLGPQPVSATSMFQHASESPHNPFKTLLPRIWDVISSPGRGVLNFSPSSNFSPPSRSPSLTSPRIMVSCRHTSQEPSIPARAKGKARAFFSKNGSRSELDDTINYSELDPLDDEEGELIDDEACFVDVRATSYQLLPPELALHILLLLCPPPLDANSRSPALLTQLSANPEQEAALHAILACREVSTHMAAVGK
ncbi:hypothetical protein FA13DRAFT_1796351 [Coprinellus micaceus]|uniref:Uncharacterized protein n=1 Tax=Coprinellus micaceus TaxID=71717 RepID=A0A4Y7SUA0_COPMI|nr:hypothetical protein FA13DRAFT_1796351 [Coprinellus micaceus]